MTSGQKNKGQWRTLRKDAIPSQNLPADSPGPHMGRSSWTPPPTMTDARMHQQMAQAIYVQTMLAMQAAGITALGPEPPSSPSQAAAETETSTSPPLPSTFTQLEQILAQKSYQNIKNTTQSSNCEVTTSQIHNEMHRETVTFKCTQCSKCFKDPDVFILHKRTHPKDETGNTDDMLRANPILANLLKSDTQQAVTTDQNNLDSNNVKSIESQIMSALAANMENYLRNLSTIMTNGNTGDTIGSQFENGTSDSQDGDSNCDSKDLNESSDSNLVIDEDAS